MKAGVLCEVQICMVSPFAGSEYKISGGELGVYTSKGRQ